VHYCQLNYTCSKALSIFEVLIKALSFILCDAMAYISIISVNVLISGTADEFHHASCTVTAIWTRATINCVDVDQIDQAPHRVLSLCDEIEGTATRFIYGFFPSRSVVTGHFFVGSSGSGANRTSLSTIPVSFSANPIQGRGPS